MRHNAFVLRSIAAAGLACLLSAGEALAGGDYDQAATYNSGFGMAPGEENAAVSSPIRDAQILGSKCCCIGIQAAAFVRREPK